MVGQAYEQILRIADDYDLVVVGSHGSDNLVNRVLLGDVANKVVSRSPTTVTVVR
ncbi:MAG: universal stress protein [Halobacteria archaeon]